MILDLAPEARRHRPTLAAIPGTLRQPAIATWRARMVNEHGSAVVFEALAAQMANAGYASNLVAECAAFADEERTHGVLCGAVVEALGGEACAPALAQRTLPEHHVTTRRAAVLRNFVSVSCMSETVAVALIGAEKMEMQESGAAPELVALLARIHADEIGHARFGWRLLEKTMPELDDAEREAVRRYVPTALEHLREHELAHLPERGGFEGGERFGLCRGEDARVLLEETIAEVIVPGLVRLLG